MVIGVYVEHSLQRPSEGQWFSERLQCSVPNSEQQVNCQKLNDQQNGRAPKGIALPILANILIGLECFYAEPCRDAKANRGSAS
ncbi:hypothetical protein [Mesorhizobium amorphae]|uniref:Uncharacterized protein n=1 Tax=Mesorhizobium amorphae CCNWGS0123 TaxID=1082933 RepID=G6YHC4_9HYPH|nr:hypothetical protein [Mesorhizobium amorphae]ANT52018.1 hypothetical protein A6B35_20040 [Mesorhizobium amorphae CCNWGS0123]EHH07816.1 hypothetical protein MEA186_26956 [Mesorhizobium amorphae CCNWGS0123]GLR44664.1 hypothetical protein GCM10007880_51810 [Mesorhizobium amorphae]